MNCSEAKPTFPPPPEAGSIGTPKMLCSNSGGRWPNKLSNTDKESPVNAPAVAGKPFRKGAAAELVPWRPFSEQQALQ